MNKPDYQEFFRLLSDDTRIRVLMLLQCEGELCVCELTHALALSQPKISRHLAQLRDSSLVKTRRAGQWMYYRLNSALPVWEKSVISATLKGCCGIKPFVADLRALKKMPDRPAINCCIDQ